MNLPKGALSTGLPQRGRAADYPSLSSCEIKVCAAVPPFPHVFRARCLISAQTRLYLAVTVTHVTDRNSTFSHGDTTTQGKPDKGCPQGEFWCLVVNDLLEDLQKQGFLFYGYADETAILGGGNFHNTLRDLIINALQIVQR